MRKLLINAVACLALIPLHAEEESPFKNLLDNSSFEKADASEPASWRIADKTFTSLAQDKARTGKNSLKIEDASDTEGSSAYSKFFPVKPGSNYAIRLWCLSDKGSRGLGVYFAFRNAEGKESKELLKAREKSIQRAPSKAGEWAQTFVSASPPDEAKTVGIWLHTFTNYRITCYVDDVELLEYEGEALEEFGLWSGGTMEQENVKDGNIAVRWSHGSSTSLSLNMRGTEDWTKSNGIEFWLHSDGSVSRFMLIISSENEKTEGIDYYHLGIKLNWKGWRRFLLPYGKLSKSREPVGWNKIDSVRFRATGWGNTPNPKTVVILDGFKRVNRPHKKGAKGPLIQDKEFFHALNLDSPALKDVRAAVETEDWALAKSALAIHLRSREKPNWFFDWRDRPHRNLKTPAGGDDPDQWDYYSTYINLDWRGWKHFSFSKSDFNPKAFVEGKGWKQKKPVGWHWIRYAAINASGWGLTPNANAALYFDDFKLVGKEKSLTLDDFETGSNWRGLESTTSHAKNGKAAGCWKSMAAVTGIKCETLPHDWTDYDRLEFWAYLEEPTESKVILVLDSDLTRKGSSSADAYVNKEFKWKYGSQYWGVKFDKQIDWSANPTQGEARTHLWNEKINRHFHFVTLADAYWNTGNGKYAKALSEQLVDWILNNPPPEYQSGNGPPDGNLAWQTLTTGIRLEGTWPNSVFRCLDSEHFTPEVLTLVLKSVYEQAEHLRRWPSRGNWLTEERMGLLTAGMLFPEFKNAKEWREIAIDTLHKQLTDEVYPDGMQIELAGGYNNWVLSSFSKVLQYADMNDLQDELPKDYKSLIKKMYSYLLYASMPNGVLPGLNDSGPSNIRKRLLKGWELFPHRKDFLFGATAGAQGERPEKLSTEFPYSGHYVMRKSWSPVSPYLLFDSGPFGFGHQHEDKLHFVLYAFGKSLILDPGNYSYDRSKWRRYVLGTHGHNTVMVDGQGQQRRGRRRDEYLWPKPWDKPRPPENDTVWKAQEAYDFVKGVYRSGYGKKRDQSVTHTRRISFIKNPGKEQVNPFWIVSDTMAPSDEKEHHYTSLFHLDATEAKLDEKELSVITQNENDANLLFIPLRTEGLSVRIVKGQVEPQVQGWANHPWRAVPTILCEKKSIGITHLTYVLYPLKEGESAPNHSLSKDDVGLRMTLGENIFSLSSELGKR